MPLLNSNSSPSSAGRQFSHFNLYSACPAPRIRQSQIRRLVFTSLMLALLLAAHSLQKPVPAFAAPQLQNNSQLNNPAGQHIYFTPAEATNVGVEVHIAELWVSAVGADNYVDVDATYRLKNPDRAAASPLIRLATAGAEVGVTRLPHISNLSVTSGDAGVGLQETEAGNYTFRVQVPADGRTTLRLRYRVALGNQTLATVRYTLEPLNRWSGEVSIRVEAKVPDAIATDSWTRVEPDGWSYGLATDPGRVDVKWLYNRRAPATPIIFQFVNPGLWQQIRSLEMTPPSSRSFSQYSRLAQLYRELYNAAGETAQLRDRFLAQSVAAFIGATSAPGGENTERGALHYSLAQLYRTHAPFVSEAQANEYAQLMVEEVAAALTLLPGDDPRVAEMGRWRADGLTLLLNQARAQSEWDQALAIVDELETLPPGSVSPEFLEGERSDLLIQKALQLLEQGDRAAAFAVAGPQLSGAQLEPPDQMQNLFLRWALTVTASPEHIHITALAQTDPERHAVALRAGQDMVTSFGSGVTRRSSEVRADISDTEWNGAPALEIRLALPSTADATFLANLTPAGMDWILLRTLLGQLGVQVNQENGLIRRTVTLRQPMDLRPAATQWGSMASTLDRQAEDFETAAIVTSHTQTALTNRVRAVHYRSMAERWRTLANQSRLYFEFRVGADAAALSADLPPPSAMESQAASGPIPVSLSEGTQLSGDSQIQASGLLGSSGATRAWYTGVAGPSQVFTMQAQVLNMMRLLTVVIVALGTVLALSGLLWWLL